MKNGDGKATTILLTTSSTLGTSSGIVLAPRVASTAPEVVKFRSQGYAPLFIGNPNLRIPLQVLIALGLNPNGVGSISYV